MKYGNYNFKPIGKLKKIDEIAQLLLKTSDIKIWDKLCEEHYKEKASVEYSHSDFYKAMDNVDDDLFLCLENEKIYIPCEHELFEFMGYRW